ncbi:BnaA01g30570D [Brassica napus]|uniref:BnaA01g30570D protein n=1 Tax=Brassica napus TaxID=3708 RepID=A0A078IND0_BRANA|nr:BnaA01g30570D [Brassica napus]
MLGGVRDVPSNENSVEVESLARFAVDEHNKKENALLDVGEALPSTTITPSDLGCKKGEGASGWREVPGDDPEVQHVADHAVKSIQQRSNSLFPYELQEVVHANAEVTGEAAKYNMVLKLKRGEKEEKFKVEVHKNHEGVLHLNHMEQHHD